MLWFERNQKSNRIVKQALLCGTLAFLLAILMMTQSAIPTLVLCHGDGGHMAVETAHVSACREASLDLLEQAPSTGSKSASEKTIRQGKQSTTCLDIPLANDVIAWQISSLRKSFTHSIRLTLAIPTSSNALFAESTIQSLSPFFGLSPPPALSALSALRTVVLLN